MIKENVFSVFAKPNSKKTEYEGFDKNKNLHIIRVAAPASNNKANFALLKFLRKFTGKNARIKIGLRNKAKVIELF